MAAIDEAKKILDDFEKSPGSGSWPHLKSADIISGARARLDDPGKIRQGAASLCGPASLLFCLILNDPKAYAWYVTHLWTNGSAKIGTLDVKPGLSLRTYDPPASKIAPVDWMTLASIRDSENAVLSYDSVDVAAGGITMPGTLSGWFSKVGIGSGKNVTNVVFTKGKSDIEDAERLRATMNHVCLFINADMLDSAKQDNKSVIPNHWVVLSGPVSFLDKDRIVFTVFTWGNGSRAVPTTGDLSLSSFLKNFYGFVSAPAKSTYNASRPRPR